MGTLSPCPWNLSLSRQNGSLEGGGCAARHSGPWVGAQVASLRCPILRPSVVSINRGPGEGESKSKNFLPELPPVRYNNYVLGAVRWPVLR